MPLLVGLGLLAKPALHLGRAFVRDVATVEPAPAGYVDDASRLNQTRVAEVRQIALDGEDPEGQLAELLRRARENGLRVSIAGARHTMGGHTIHPGGLVIDMLPWNRMELDVERNILTVQAGALWADVLAYLDRRGRSVAVMQSNNSFSVGGSISANCHGWQFDRPPIASTVDSFRLMLADGTIVRCSRSEHAELFSLALGGYGLFGIILDVDLRVVPNERYRMERFRVPIDQAWATWESEFEGRSDVQMVYARMSIVPGKLFEEVVLHALVPDPGGEIPSISEPGLTELRRAIFRGSADDDYGKRLRWTAETRLQEVLAGRVFSRNQLLNEGVEVFQDRSAVSTDILHEYFVPRHRVAAFVDAMRDIVAKHRPNLLNLTVRSVNEDRDTFLRYADQDLFAFVMLFVQERTAAGERDMEALTRELIDAVLEHEGRYYLPYRLHATLEQFDRAYPQAREFFRLKRKYDPEELFQNRFHATYGTITE